jgi:pentatricopeptide repeat protein
MNLTATTDDGFRLRPHSVPLLLQPHQHVASGHGVTCIWYVGFVSNFPQNICKHRRNWGTNSHGSINVVSSIQRGRGPSKPKVFQSKSKGASQSEMQFTQLKYQPDMQSLAIPDLRDIIPKASSLGGNPAHEYEYDDPSEQLNEAQDNKVLKILNRAGKPAQDINHLEKMEEKNHIPDVKACTRLIYCLCRDGSVMKADRVLELLLRLGYVPDAISSSLVITRLCRMGHFQRVAAHRFLDEMGERGYRHLEVTYNRVLRTLSRQGELDHALEVMNRQFQRVSFMMSLLTA